MEKNTIKPDVLVAIIGAGFSGLGMAIKLRAAGMEDFLIVEAASEVGGTWRDSKYPGAAVDVPSHLYSYSFEQTNWSRMFAKSEEIQQYIVDTTEHHNLRPKIRFNTKVVKARFDKENGLWVIETAGGDTLRARFVVGAMGPFAAPSVPDIPGIKDFKGITVHTAAWKKGLDLKGKRVAVVGSGASAIQVVPAIAPLVKELKVFQRTPSWIVPKADYEYSELEKLMYRYLPFTQKLRRATIFGLTELLATAIVWDTPMTTLLENVCKRQIDRAIKDPVLRRKVTPDYRLGRTRMLISNDWYPALARPNVELIDHGVEALTEKGIRAAGKEYEVDVIVWATGYKSPSQGFPFPLTGVGGRDLNAYWKDGAKAYKGVAIAGFPNLFTLMGPNTGPGHTSVLVYTEAQMAYAVQAIQACEKRQIKSLAVREDRQEEFNRELDEKMRRTTWGSGGNSWYYTKDGRNTTLYPGFATEYVWSVRNFNLGDYKVTGWFF
ncbi:MAG: NAD(P)/FAD-dependent oxidoreductase [Spirochaetes bacterium]|nr:NAD(P)/FAD-dependent oxidoreductase [Spirochaetota bacterium]